MRRWMLMAMLVAGLVGCGEEEPEQGERQGPPPPGWLGEQTVLATPDTVWVEGDPARIQATFAIDPRLESPVGLRNVETLTVVLTDTCDTFECELASDEYDPMMVTDHELYFEVVCDPRADLPESHAFLHVDTARGAFRTSNLRHFTDLPKAGVLGYDLDFVYALEPDSPRAICERY